MGLFLSTFVNKIDKKGRVSVPASFRAALAGEEFQGVVVFPSYTQNALEGVGMSAMADLADRMDDNFAMFSDDHGEMATTLFGESMQLVFDGDGRITVPQSLMAQIGVSNEIAFVGLGHKFQIWNPQALEVRKKESLKKLKKKKLTLPKERKE